MKKIISILSICFLFAMLHESKAQVQTMTSATTYSVVDTGTINLDLKVAGNYKNITVQYVCTKVSGTVAGTAKLYGSLDGTNYELIPNKMFRDTLNSFTNTNVSSQNKIWKIYDSPYLYYRVAVVGSGTMVATVTGKLLARKED